METIFVVQQYRVDTDKEAPIRMFFHRKKENAEERAKKLNDCRNLEDDIYRYEVVSVYLTD